LWSSRYAASAFSRAARCWKSSASSAGTPDAVRMVDGLGEVEFLGVGVGHDRAVDGAGQHSRGLRADPAPGDAALQGGESGQGSLLGRRPAARSRRRRK
jgi:hypothetical protein